MNRELLEKYEELSCRVVACKHWHWRIGMAAIAANDLARLFTPNGDLPIKSEVGVRLISHTYSEARYAFCEHDGVRRAHEKAYVTMLTDSEEHDWCGEKDDDSQVAFIHRNGDNEDDCSSLWVVGFAHLVNLRPDFHDTVTVRGLLQVVRAAWRLDSLHTRLGVDGWEVRDTYTTVVDGKPTTIVCGMDWKGRGGAIDPNGSYGSEIEALVAALEAAP